MDRLILKNINELVTCAEGKGRVKNGCIIIEDGIIKAAGTMQDTYIDHGCEIIDCSKNAVLPGFIDPHTHFVFAGYRQDEFKMRLGGSSYMDIMKAGGGIASTVKATREASIDELIDLGLERADSMLGQGVTTVEGKSGYGLDKETELKQLKAMKKIDKKHPVDVIPTFLGAHSLPDEYRGKKRDYLEFLLNEVLLAVREENLAEFVDIFCEKGVFDTAESERYLNKAANLGFGIRIHADEIVSTGGAEMAARTGAYSADHLLKASEKGIREMAKKGVIATLLPATAFCLKEEFADARSMIDAGCRVALATDFNPGSSFTNSIPLVIALAALKMDMTVDEILKGLTINAAYALGRQDVIGSIEPGKKADISVLRYPSVDFLAYNTGMNQISKVIKNGKVVYEKNELD